MVRRCRREDEAATFPGKVRVSKLILGLPLAVSGLIARNHTWLQPGVGGDVTVIARRDRADGWAVVAVSFAILPLWEAGHASLR
jgi:hypothetical protein